MAVEGKSQQTATNGRLENIVKLRQKGHTHVIMHITFSKILMLELLVGSLSSLRESLKVSYLSARPARPPSQSGAGWRRRRNR